MNETKDTGRFLVRNENEWQDVLEVLSNGALFVCKSHTNGTSSPIDYPCIVKVAETIVMDEDNNEVPAYFVMLFYKDEACDLLGISRQGIKDYKYAEAL